MLPYPSGRVVAVDTETSGLFPYLGDTIFCVGWADDAGGSGCFQFDARGKDWLIRLFNDPDKVIVFHNAKFDLSFLHVAGIPIRPKGEISCTLLLAGLFNEDEPHDLRFLSRKYLDRETAKKDAVDDWIRANRRAFMKKHRRKPNFGDVPMDLVTERVVWDAQSCLLLYHFYWPHVKRICYELYLNEVEVMYECIAIEARGEMVDITRAKKLRKQSRSNMREIHDRMSRMVCPFDVHNTQGEFRERVDGKETPFNPNSKYHLEGAFRKLGIELKYRTKKFNWSFDEYSMIQYCHPALHEILRDSGEEGWPFRKYYGELIRVGGEHKLPETVLFVPLVLKYRELAKMISTYYDHLVSECTDEQEIIRHGKRIEVGILHCSYNPFRAKTGRMSCSRPNKQNMPRLMGPRECFIPRPGYIMVHFDYDQVEMKFSVHFSGDPFLRKAIEGDIHQSVASQIYKVKFDKVSKEQRKRAKGVNFGIIYGAGGPKIAQTLTEKWLPTTEGEGRSMVKAYHQRFPAVHRLISSLKAEIARKGFLTNPYGRRYMIPMDKAYVAINYLCQGTSADLMKIGVVKVARLLRRDKWDAHLMGVIHDEVVVEMRAWDAAKLCPLIVNAMEERTKFKVPITVGVEIVRNRWSKKEDFVADKISN